MVNGLDNSALRSRLADAIYGDQLFVPGRTDEKLERVMLKILWAVVGIALIGILLVCPLHCPDRLFYRRLSVIHGPRWHLFVCRVGITYPIGQPRLVATQNAGCRVDGLCTVGWIHFCWHDRPRWPIHCHRYIGLAVCTRNLRLGSYRGAIALPRELDSQSLPSRVDKAMRLTTRFSVTYSCCDPTLASLGTLEIRSGCN